MQEDIEYARDHWQGRVTNSPLGDLKDASPNPLDELGTSQGLITARTWPYPNGVADSEIRCGKAWLVWIVPCSGDLLMMSGSRAWTRQLCILEPCSLRPSTESTLSICLCNEATPGLYGLK